MASLLVAGAVEGLGGGIVENVERETEDRRRGEDEAHDMQLERQRQKFLRSQQTSSQEFTTARDVQTEKMRKEQYGVLRGHELEDF